ncbi:invasion associated locus B family protein [Devosia salina]|uniref:Invasion associated locus B family protein n=2 Tax=Devosia salina TaxID=2860336 RepID=A0ABX8WPM0_9HYPH|nr:invasion associated locus B family protein [Devosia salina]
MPSPKSVLAATLALVLSISVSHGQETGLPGNASSLLESHGSWQLVCTSPEGTVRCVLSQTQLAENRQKVLSIELSHGDDRNTASGVLVLPFGLDLARGITYRLDEDQASAVQPFRTCLPVGCLVDIAFDADMVASLGTGDQLDVIATADGGQEIAFSISLAGFSNAHDRMNALLR